MLHAKCYMQNATCKLLHAKCYMQNCVLCLPTKLQHPAMPRTGLKVYVVGGGGGCKTHFSDQLLSKIKADQLSQNVP